MSEKSQLIDKLISNRKTREAYIRSKVCISVASQLRAVRRREGLTQEGLADLSEMKQSRISAMERPGTRWNIETPIRLVAALRRGLVVKVVSFSEMLNSENEFSQDTFNPVKIDDDIDFRQEDSPALIEEPHQPVSNETSTAMDVRQGQQESPHIDLGQLLERPIGYLHDPLSSALMNAGERRPQMLAKGAGG